MCSAANDLLSTGFFISYPHCQQGYPQSIDLDGFLVVEKGYCFPHSLWLTNHTSLYGYEAMPPSKIDTFSYPDLFKKQ